MTSRFEKRPSAVMISSAIPSLKKSWPGSPERFSKGNTASDGRPARRLGAARLVISRGLDAAPIQGSSQPLPVCNTHPTTPAATRTAAPAAAAAAGHRFFWTRCCGRQAHRIGANRIGNIFDAMAAERTVIEIELVSDLIVDRLRDADGPGLGKRLEPGGNVDAVAKDVVAVANHIAEMTAD